MKKLLLIVLLIVGCDEETTAPIIEGCTTSTACNYNAEAGKDDGSCTFAEENFDCDGNCITVEDCLVGSWKSTESKMTYNLEGTINISNEIEYYLYVFNSDGTGNYTSSQSVNQEAFMISYYTGTWMINNNQLVYEGQNVSNGQPIVSNWYFNLNEDILILSNIENYEHGVTNGFYCTFQKQ